MDKLSNCLDFFLTLFKDANLIRDRALSQFVYPEGQVNDCRELDWSKVVAMRMNNQADVERRWWVQCAVLNQICVDNRIKTCIMSVKEDYISTCDCGKTCR